MAVTLGSLGVTLNILSGAAIAVLGVLVLWGGRSKPRGGLAFALFTLFWGVQITLANLAGAASDQATASTLYVLSWGLLIPLAYFLVEFTAAQVGARGQRGPWDLFRWLAGGAAVVSALLYIVAQDLMFQGVAQTPLGWAPVVGPLWVPLVSLPRFGSLGLALYYLAGASRRSPTPRTASRATVLVIGLGLYTAYAASRFLGSSIQFVSQGLGGFVWAFTALFVALTLVTVHLGIEALLAARLARSRAERAREHRLAAALLIPLAWGAIEAGLVAGLLPTLDTLGIWRLTGVAIMAYGLARWWMPELQRTAKLAASRTTGLTAAGAGGATVYGAGTALSSGLVLPAIAGLATVSALAIPSLKLSRKLFRIEPRPVELESGDERFGEQLDTYRAALEASLARGTLEEDEAFLDALQDRFDLGQEARRVLHYYASKSVIVPVDGTAEAAYERLRLLGEGGGGRTWLARDRARERLVVLKEPLGAAASEQLRARVLEEAQLARRVRHPNVVEVHEVTERDGRPVIVMEYMEGGSLLDVLRHEAPLDPGRAVPLVVQVLAGLEAVHHRDILHRDIKPSNILLDETGTPKIADFGIAVRHTPDKTIVEDPGLAGTLAYLPPEVRTGQAQASQATDVYACTAVLYELLFGHPPEPGAPIATTGLPAPLTEVLQGGLSSDPGPRYTSARQLRRALEGL